MTRPIGLMVKAAKDPRVALTELHCLLRGHAFKLWCKVTRKRFSAGRSLRLEGRIHLKGQGRVTFGNNVRVGMLVTPWTHSRSALIEIGSDSYINGTSFGCQELIRVGPRAILGRCRIMDTNFHSLSPARHSRDAPVKTRPVILEENVWIAANAGLLPGTHIGKNSVVGFGAVCSGDYPADVLIAGNPARVVKSIAEDDRAPA